MDILAKPCHFCKIIPVINNRDGGDVARCNDCWMQSPRAATPDETIEIWNIMQSNFDFLAEISDETGIG